MTRNPTNPRTTPRTPGWRQLPLNIPDPPAPPADVEDIEAWRDGYRTGYADGWEAGDEATEAEVRQ